MYNPVNTYNVNGVLTGVSYETGLSGEMDVYVEVDDILYDLFVMCVKDVREEVNKEVGDDEVRCSEAIIKCVKCLLIQLGERYKRTGTITDLNYTSFSLPYSPSQRFQGLLYYHQLLLVPRQPRNWYLHLS